jgi:CRP-like cAMP-binding protein
MCILNHTSTEDDVEQVLAFLEHAEPIPPRPHYDRDEPVVEAVPLFARLEPAERSAFEELAFEREVAAGGRVIERWDTSRELYVLEDGHADVYVNGDVVNTLRPGDHFGEIAALEWSAGFARSRAADVVARDDVLLRVLDPTSLSTLLLRFPRLETELRRSAHDRLRRAR